MWGVDESAVQLPRRLGVLCTHRRLVFTACRVIQFYTDSCKQTYSPLCMTVTAVIVASSKSC